jgi:hypothetical protein
MKQVIFTFTRCPIIKRSFGEGIPACGVLVVLVHQRLHSLSSTICLPSICRPIYNASKLDPLPLSCAASLRRWVLCDPAGSRHPLHNPLITLCLCLQKRSADALASHATTPPRPQGPSGPASGAVWLPKLRCECRRTLLSAWSEPSTPKAKASPISFIVGLYM